MKAYKILLLFIGLCGLTSFQKDKTNYNFKISATNIVDRIPKSITVKIVNSAKNKVELTNLTFDFFLDEDGYWGTIDNRTDKNFIVKPNQNVEKLINFDSLTFTSYTNHKVISPNDFKKLIKNSKKTSLKATLNDIRRLDNPLESSSLTHSNIIELNKK